VHSSFDPDVALAEIQALRAAVIDSSSVIYASKSGVLQTLVHTIDLCTVSGVVSEVGYSLPDVTVVRRSTAGIPVDTQILDLAQERGLPVVTEDRKIFLKAADIGVDAHNMLIILELLLLRNRLSLVEWDAARKRLLAAAQYGARVIHAGLELHAAVRKQTG
jgi:hypothetical protein